MSDNHHGDWQRQPSRYSAIENAPARDVFDAGFGQNNMQPAQKDTSAFERGRSTNDLRRRTHTGIGSAKQRNKSCCAGDIIRMHQNQRSIEDKSSYPHAIEDSRDTRGAPTPSKSVRSGRKQSVGRHQDLMDDDDVSHCYGTPYPKGTPYPRTQDRRQSHMFTPGPTPGPTPGRRLSGWFQNAYDQFKEYSSPWTGSKAQSRTENMEADDDEFSPDVRARKSARRPHRESMATAFDTPHKDRERDRESRVDRERDTRKDEAYLYQGPRHSYQPRPSPYTEAASKAPMIISRYILLLMNLFVVGASIYCIYNFYNTINNDIEGKVQLHKEEILDEISRCQRDYRENRCDPAIRVPAMEDACREWEACMNRDPYAVARRAKFSGETLGEAINAFFEALTWKAVICMSLMFFGTVFTYNLCFWLFAKKLESTSYGYAPNDAYPAPNPAQEYEEERWRERESGRGSYAPPSTSRRLYR